MAQGVKDPALLLRLCYTRGADSISGLNLLHSMSMAKKKKKKMQEALNTTHAHDYHSKNGSSNMFSKLFYIISPFCTHSSCFQSVLLNHAYHTVHSNPGVDTLQRYTQDRTM